MAQALRDDPDLRFELCLGVSGVHYPHETGRELHAVYHFLSITHDGRRIRVEVTCPDDDPHIPSIVSVYPANDWHERETWDFFGIVFDGHPALTRILMPDDWPGHPQRKDYPLGGIPVEYKGADDPAAGPAEVVQLMTDHTPAPDAAPGRRLHAATSATPSPTIAPPRAPASSTPPAATGTTSSTRPPSLGEERIVVNMGPQHPSTHGVLRLILEIDGETVTETRAGIGYLHTGIEKNMEFRTWTQGVTFCTRMDYLTPMFQEAAYCLAVEKLLGITDQIPERATVIRVLMMELNRISSHLVALGHRRHGDGRDARS